MIESGVYADEHVFRRPLDVGDRYEERPCFRDEKASGLEREPDRPPVRTRECPRSRGEFSCEPSEIEFVFRRPVRNAEAASEIDMSYLREIEGGIQEFLHRLREDIDRQDIGADMLSKAGYPKPVFFREFPSGGNICKRYAKLAVRAAGYHMRMVSGADALVEPE